MGKLVPGRSVRFSYNELAGSMTKEVFVLNDDGYKVHGIDLANLNPADREVLETIMVPSNKCKIHRNPLVNDIFRRMDPWTEINNPLSFYAKFVRPFLNGKDAYRTYWANKVVNPTEISATEVRGIATQTPLFHGVDSKQPEAAAAPQPKNPAHPVIPPKKGLFTPPPLPRKGSTIRPRVQRATRAK